MEKLTVAISSSAIDKLTSLGVILSGAAADDLEVELFILVNAGHAFMKDNAENLKVMSDDAQTPEQFQAKLEELNSASWLELLDMAKELTSVKVFMCSLAGKIAGGNGMEDYIDAVDEICGIGEYMTSLGESDANIFI